MLVDFARLYTIAMAQGNTKAARMIADVMAWLLESRE